MPPHTETSVGWSSFHSRGLDLILIFYAQVLEGQLAKNAGIKKKKGKCVAINGSISGTSCTMSITKMILKGCF